MLPRRLHADAAPALRAAMPPARSKDVKAADAACASADSGALMRSRASIFRDCRMHRLSPFICPARLPDLMLFRAQRQAEVRSAEQLPPRRFSERLIDFARTRDAAASASHERAVFSPFFAAILTLQIFATYFGFMLIASPDVYFAIALPAACRLRASFHRSRLRPLRLALPLLLSAFAAGYFQVAASQREDIYFYAPQRGIMRVSSLRQRPTHRNTPRHVVTPSPASPRQLRLRCHISLMAARLMP